MTATIPSRIEVTHHIPIRRYLNPWRLIPVAIMLTPMFNQRADMLLSAIAPATPAAEVATVSATSDYLGYRIAAQAKTWPGAYYKKGVPAMCAGFVRYVLALEDATIPTGKGSAGPLMADSFHAPEQGKIILNPSELVPGDIVMFSNTYRGPGRYLNGGNITHVGIYVGGGMMVDRPTSRGTVQYRPITTFKFNSALRPNIYGEPPAAPQGSPSDELLTRAIGDSEGTRNADGTPNKNYYGHKDPGNGKHNVGSFSYQHGAPSPEVADQRWLEVLRKAEKDMQAQAQSKFKQPLSTAAIVAGLDGYTQSPDAGKRYVKHLDSANPSVEQIIDARIAALNESRRVFPGGPLNVPADQKRRVSELMRHL